MLWRFHSIQHQVKASTMLRNSPAFVCSYLPARLQFLGCNSPRPPGRCGSGPGTCTCCDLHLDSAPQHAGKLRDKPVKAVKIDRHYLHDWFHLFWLGDDGVIASLLKGYSLGFLHISQFGADVSQHVQGLEVVRLHIQGPLAEKASHLKIKCVHVFFCLQHTWHKNQAVSDNNNTAILNSYSSCPSIVSTSPFLVVAVLCTFLMSSSLPFRAFWLSSFPGGKVQQFLHLE